MDENINVAEILKDKKNGLRLYSPIFGECTFCCVCEDTNDICVKKHNGVKEFFDSKGLYYNTGEVMLFPSKSMRDWEKFSWKNGDVLVNSSGFKLLFDRWANDDYTRFFGKFNILEDSFSYETEKYTLVSKDETIDTFEIEKPEFKDGDIVTIINGCEQRCILIFRNIIGDSLNRYCILTRRGLFTEGYSLIDKEDSLLFATEEEKQQLFSALEKEGKAWDAEKKTIVDLKPKVELKPFDKVLVRDFSRDKWGVSFFSFKKEDFYVCINDCSWNQCIPYNEETAHLLGTTDEWKGGEG